MSIEVLRPVRLTMLGLVCTFAIGAGERAGDWTGDYPPCDRHREVMTREHLNLGVRFSTTDRELAAAFVRAMNFWTTILDMEWHQEDSRDCSIQIVDGKADLFRPGEVARAQIPGWQTFQGWIAFNPKASLSVREQYLASVHEVGHMMGLRHNPSARSVMYYLSLDEPVVLDAADLAALSAYHKLRIARMDKSLIVGDPTPLAAGASLYQPALTRRDAAEFIEQAACLPSQSLSHSQVCGRFSLLIDPFCPDPGLGRFVLALAELSR